MELVFLEDDQPEFFPDPRNSDDSGLVGLSKSLGTKRIIAAYQQGIFPWMKMEESPYLWCWYSPNPRMLLYPDEFKTPRSLTKAIKNKIYEVRIDHDFAQVMSKCASIKRSHEAGSWIEPDMQIDYGLLHQQGIAHSIEAYLDGELAGGLYGLALGNAFFGESMFHLSPEASKVCMAKLVEIAQWAGLSFIDCQVPNPFLHSLGAREVKRDWFLDELGQACKHTKSSIDWTALAENNS